MSVRVERFCDDFQRYCKEYGHISHIHGVQHVAEQRAFMEKVFWTLISVAAMGLCLMVVSRIYVKYDKSPVVVGFHNRHTPIYELPFPVVTICPESKMKPDVFSYSNISYKLANNESISPKDHLLYQYFYSICDQYPPYDDYGIRFYNESFFKAINEIKRDLDEILVYCKYMGTPFECSKVFQPVLLAEGVCFSFNNLDRSHIFRSNVYFCCDFFKNNVTKNEWDSIAGFGNTGNLYTYPRRALFSGAHKSLILHLRMDPMRDRGLVCKSARKGFRVFLYNPAELPSSSGSFVRADLGQVVNIAVLPDDKRITDTVGKVHWSKRGCYMGDERYLQYFKMYTENNCMLECVTNYTLFKCGCVAFYMPRTQKTPVCGSGKYHCVKTSERMARRLDIGSKLAAHTRRSRPYCNCLPRCSYLSYDYEVSSTGWYYQEFRQRHQYFSELKNMGNNETLTQVRIYFKSEFVLKVFRSELYGWYELTAKLGSILSLCLGISLVSLWELCYFFTIRIGANRYLYRRWAGGGEESLVEINVVK